MHLLFEGHPALELAGLVNNLKTASARKLKKPYGEQLRKFYWKPGLWPMRRVKQRNHSYTRCSRTNFNV